MRRILTLAVALALSACASDQKPDNAAACADYQAQRSRVEVTISGTAVHVLGTRRGRSGTHEGFLLRPDASCDLLLRVETNIDLTGPVPLSDGDRVVVRGEYEYNPLGGVVHWTHHDPRGRHEGGYVQVGGRLYQ